MIEKDFATYPLLSSAQTHEASSLLSEKQKEIINLPVFDKFEPKTKVEIAIFLDKYQFTAERMFVKEEEKRSLGLTGANLYYHGRPHAIYQAVYDATSLVNAISAHEGLNRHLTAEGALAIVLGAEFHDTGYVYNAPFGEVNYAKRAEGHVERSADALSDKIDQIGMPAEINSQKVKDLARLGIYNTTFPLTNEVKMALKVQTDRYAPKARAEAHIVRLAIQLADLGGQVARIDSTTLLNNLRAELNGANPGSGDEIIGVSEAEMSQKRREFINNHVIPYVGKAAAAFYKKPDNPFSLAWKK